MKQSRVPKFVATTVLLTAIGCQPDAPADGASVAGQGVSNVTTSSAEAAPDLAVAEEDSSPRWNFTAPSLLELHARWDEALEESDAEFAEEFRRRRSGGVAPWFTPAANAGLLSLPSLSSAAPEDADGPLERAETQDLYCRRVQSLWTEEVDAHIESHDLREDEAAALRAMALTFGCGAADTKERFQESLAKVREAGADDAVLKTLLALKSAQAAEPGELRTADLAELVRLSEAVADDASVPGALRFRASMWGLFGGLLAKNSGVAEGEYAELPETLQVSARLEANAKGLRAFAASVTPEAVEARPQLPRFLLDNAWDVLCLFPNDDPPRLTLIAALSDAAADGGDPYAFHVILSELLEDAGWDSRGAASADRVTQEGWAGLHQYATAAGRHAHAAWLDHPNLPCAPALLEGISRGGGSPLDEREWFAEAVAAQVDYSLAHSTLRIGLLPRWGGSHAEMIALAQECLRDDLLESETPLLGLDMIWAVVEDLEDDYGPPPREMWRNALSAYADWLVEDVGEGPFAIDGSYGAWAKRIGALARSLAAEEMPDRQLAVLKLWPESDPIQLRPVLDGYRRAFIAGPLAAAHGDAAEAAARLKSAVHPEAPVLTAAEVADLRDDVQEVREAAGDDQLQLDWMEDVDVTLQLLEGLHSDSIQGFFFRPELPGWRCGASWFRVEPGESRDSEYPRGMADLYGEGRADTPYLSLLTKLPEPFTLTASFAIDPLIEGPPKVVGIGVGPGVWQPYDPEEDASETQGALMFVERGEGSDASQSIGLFPYPWKKGTGLLATRGFRMLDRAQKWVGVSLMAEPGRLATFAGDQFIHEETQQAPTELQPVRFGPDQIHDRPIRWQIKSIRVKYGPDFKAPAYLTNIPDHLRSAAHEER